MTHLPADAERSGREPGPGHDEQVGVPRPRYSVIVPCHDEEDSLPELTERLRSLREALSERGEVEVVVVDDGSRDSTAALAERLLAGDGPHQVLRHGGNLGIGTAMRTGIGAARGGVICVVDADGTYDPLMLTQLIGRLEAGADMSTASPYHPEGVVEGVGGWRLFLSRSLNRAYSWLLPGRFYTVTSCFRAFRSDVARECLPDADGFDSVAEMLCVAVLQGYWVAEVPATLSGRRRGASKMIVGKEIRNHLGILARLALRRGPFATAALEARR